MADLTDTEKEIRRIAEKYSFTHCASGNTSHYTALKELESFFDIERQQLLKALYSPKTMVTLQNGEVAHFNETQEKFIQLLIAERTKNLRQAARWLAENSLVTLVPDWVDDAINGN